MDSLEASRPRPPTLGSDWALFLDVDGCLLEHAPSPQLAHVPTDLPSRLRRLAHELDGALALVSGRSIQALDELFPDCAQLTFAGLHGLEWRAARSRGAAPEAPPAFAALVGHARALVHDYPQVCIETAGPCLNLHWRSAPQAAGVLTDFAETALGQLPGYRLHLGIHGIEIRPDGVDKGRAIADLLTQSPFAGRRPVFAGDDPADEPGFAVINAHNGVSVLVGERADSAARYALRDPAQVRRWLGVTAEAG